MHLKWKYTNKNHLVKIAVFLFRDFYVHKFFKRFFHKLMKIAVDES